MHILNFWIERITTDDKIEINKICIIFIHSVRKHYENLGFSLKSVRIKKFKSSIKIFTGGEFIREIWNIKFIFLYEIKNSDLEMSPRACADGRG